MNDAAGLLANFFYEEKLFGIFLLVTIVLGGGAAGLPAAPSRDLAAVVAGRHLFADPRIRGALHSFQPVQRHAVVAALLPGRWRILPGLRRCSASAPPAPSKWSSSITGSTSLPARCAGAARRSDLRSPPDCELAGSTRRRTRDEKNRHAGRIAGFCHRHLGAMAGAPRLRSRSGSPGRSPAPMPRPARK